MKKLSREDFDSGIAVLISFVIYGLTLSAARLSSLLFVAAIPRYNVDRKRASFPFVLSYATRNSLGPLVGFCAKQFGIRAVTVFGCLLSAVAIGGCYFAEDIATITILWGIVYGFGFGFSTLLIPHYLSLHFSEHLDKANGLSLAGDSVGYFILSLLTEYSLVTYGLSGTYLIISGMMLHSLPVALLLKIPKETVGKDEIHNSAEKQKPPERSKDSENLANHFLTDCSVTKPNLEKPGINPFRVFLNPVFISIVIILTSMTYLHSTTFTILIDVARDHGLYSPDEVYLFMAVSVAEFFGRMLLGSITDAGYVTKLNFAALCYVCMAVLYAACILIKGYAMIMTFGFFFGLLLGGLMTVNTGLVSFYIDKEYHSVAVPSRIILYPPVSFTQAPLIGYFRDTLQSYDGLFYILIGVCCMSSAICLLIPQIIIWMRNSSQERLQTSFLPQVIIYIRRPAKAL